MRRERQHDDRRVIYAALTPCGSELLDEIFPKHAQFVAELFETLEPAELQKLRRLLKKLGLAVAARQTPDLRRAASPWR